MLKAVVSLTNGTELNFHLISEVIYVEIEKHGIHDWSLSDAALNASHGWFIITCLENLFPLTEKGLDSILC